MTRLATDLRPRSSVESQYLRCNRAFFSPILARYFAYFRFDTSEIPHFTKNAHFDKGHGRIYSRNAHSSGGNLKGFGFSSPNILKEREFALGGMVSGFVFRHLRIPIPRANYPPFVKTNFGFSKASLRSTKTRQPPLEQPYRSSRVCVLLFFCVFYLNCTPKSRHFAIIFAAIVFAISFATICGGLAQKPVFLLGLSRPQLSFSCRPKPSQGALIFRRDVQKRIHAAGRRRCSTLVQRNSQNPRSERGL